MIADAAKERAGRAFWIPASRRWTTSAPSSGRSLPRRSCPSAQSAGGFVASSGSRSYRACLRPRAGRGRPRDAAGGDADGRPCRRFPARWSAAPSGASAVRSAPYLWSSWASFPSAIRRTHSFFCVPDRSECRWPPSPFCGRFPQRVEGLLGVRRRPRDRADRVPPARLIAGGWVVFAANTCSGLAAARCCRGTWALFVVLRRFRRSDRAGRESSGQDAGPSAFPRARIRRIQLRGRSDVASRRSDHGRHLARGGAAGRARLQRRARRSLRAFSFPGWSARVLPAGAASKS